MSRKEREGTWDVQISKAIASSASHHVGPTSRALDISDPAPCARGCTAEGGYSCKERGQGLSTEETNPSSDHPTKNKNNHPALLFFTGPAQGPGS